MASARGRLVVAWAAIVAFLPLYAAAGAVLRERVGPGDPSAAGPIDLALGAAFAALSLAVGPLLIRGGLHPDPARFVAWSAAEGVAVVGLVAWVESGDPRAYALGAACALALLIALFPRSSTGGPTHGAPRR